MSPPLAAAAVQRARDGDCDQQYDERTGEREAARDQ